MSSAMQQIYQIPQTVMRPVMVVIKDNKFQPSPIISNPIGAPARGQIVTVPGQHVHLSARVSPTDERGVPAHRPAGIHQRAVRHRQDRRTQTLRKLQPAVRHQFHLGDADQPVRSERQFRPGEVARAARADAQAASGQSAGGG